MKSILIAGVPRSGKTILGSRLARELSVSHIPLDAVVTAFQAVFPEHGITHHGIPHREICKNLKPFLWEFQKELKIELKTVILDTYHILPSDAAELFRQGDWLPVFLGYPRIAVETKAAHIRTFENLSEWTRDLDDLALQKLVAEFIEKSREFESECANLKLPFIDVSQDFECSLQRGREAFLK